MKTRKTSSALTELRTVASRALTASQAVRKSRSSKHTPHELALIVTALQHAHDELNRIDQLTGYEGRDD